MLRQLGEEGSLRALRIIERSDGGPSSLAEHRQTWTLSRRMLSLLLGDDIQLDPELRELATIEDRVPNADSLAYSEGLVSRCRTAVETRHGVVSVYGLPGLGRRTLLHAVAAENDLRIIDIRSDRLASMPIEQARPQLRALARECKVLGRVPLLSCIDALPSEMIALVGEELVSRLLGPVFVTCDTARRPPLRWSRPTISIEASRPSTRRLGELWQQSFDHGCELTGNELAVAFPLAPSLIVQAAETAKATGTVSLSKLRDGIRSVVEDRLSGLARRLEVNQTWSDLVLSRDQSSQVAELIARLRHRPLVLEEWGFAAKIGKGNGVAALFSGPPGTGKSMCAGLIANELGLDLYVVDGSKISSKWIGETEKNLAALFDAAEASHAVLLFDEADALFGKRSDVKSSNDKHANAEVSYLLQRVEHYSGIAILTSNHESAIDPAFQRRLATHVRFELPDAEERSALWKAMIPSTAPVAEGLDFERLADRYEMSGGYIKNAALRAAFLAADLSTPITLSLLEHAARAEYEAMGKIAT